jgi:hypothetical protein
MKKMFRRLLDDTGTRLSVTALFVTLPLTIATSWLAAAYQNVMGNGDFVGLLLRFFVFSFVAAFAAGSALIAPLEKWGIRDRALKVSKWRVARTLIYLVAGFPVGAATLLAIRLGVGQFDPLVESAYFVTAVVFTSAVGMTYTFIEQAAEDVRRREAELAQRIKVLQIEIDDMKRERQVAEITETEYFRDLQARAREMREGE